MGMNKDGEYVATYESGSAAGRATGFKARGINRCASGDRKTCMGFLWKRGGGAVHGNTN